MNNDPYSRKRALPNLKERTLYRSLRISLCTDRWCKGYVRMSKTLVHTLHDSIELQYQQQTLFRYIYEPKIDPRESPRPYFHPLKTLAGNEVTTFRPHDHFWHVGLSMTSANLSGQNFWGGKT